MAEPASDRVPWSATRGAGRWVDEPAVGWIGLLLVAAVVGLRVLQPIENPDLGWHLALGRQIVETRSVPDTETFSHTAAGRPLVAHEWLAQVIFHGVSESFGLLGLRVFFAASAVGLLSLLFVALRREGVPPALAVLGTAAYALVAQGRFQVRPHMLHLLCFALLYTYVFVHRPKLEGRELLRIFAAVVLWANLHSGAVLFAAVVLLYVAVELLQQRAGWRRPRVEDLGGGEPRRLLLLAFAVCFALLLTPHSIQIFPYLLESQRVNAFTSLEWFPITHFWSERANFAHSIETYWLMVVATLVAAFARAGRTSSAQLAVVLFLTLLPLFGLRFLTATFASVVFVLPELARWLSARAGSETRGPPVRALAALIAALVALSCLSGLGLPGSLPGLMRGLRSGHDFRPDLFPMDAARILSDWAPEARLYHPGRWGGYLLYATRGRTPTFSDGRWVAHGDTVMADSARLEWRTPDSPALLDRYGVDLLLVPRGWMPPEWLESQEWLPIFENVNSGLYLRGSPRTEADRTQLLEYYASLGVPFDADMGFDERAAVTANPQWAREHRVRRFHLIQFRVPALAIARRGGVRTRAW